MDLGGHHFTRPRSDRYPSRRQHTGETPAGSTTPNVLSYIPQGTLPRHPTDQAVPLMRSPILSALVALLASAPTTSHAQSRAPVAPCTKATEACERWVIFGGGPARSMVYASYSLDTPNPAMTRALVMVHGAGRNADHYFETATAAGFLAGALDNTVIVSPHFTASTDKPRENEVVWPERGENWRSGGMSPTNPTISSFDFLDEILRKLSNKKTLPTLT